MQKALHRAPPSNRPYWTPRAFNPRRQASITRRSSPVNGLDPSNTANTSCATLYLFKRRSQPSCLDWIIRLFNSSRICEMKNKPPHKTVSLTRSRVCSRNIGTILRFTLSVIKFINEDFTTFGRPTITVSIPSRTRRPFHTISQTVRAFEKALCQITL